MEWLSDVLRDAGLTVIEHPGWRTRFAPDRYGREIEMRPRVVIGHHTASYWTASDANVTSLLVHGRSDLPGPLSQIGLNRRGHCIVIAAGKANHAGAGSWMDANESAEAIGIEAFNYGNHVPYPSREPWPAVQLDAFERATAAILRHLGRDQRYYCGHREWATPRDLDWRPGQVYGGRKPDPSGIDLDAMRTRIGVHIKGGGMSFTPEQEAILKELATQGTTLVQLAKGLTAPGPVTARVGNGMSPVWVLEFYRKLAEGTGVSPLDPAAIATHLLGQ